MAKRLIPLLDRVLIERVQAAVKSPGGVLLPESALPKVGTSCFDLIRFLLLFSLDDHTGE
jgi:hypothetical protein